MDISKVMVERVDILKEMGVLLKRMREHVTEVKAEEDMKHYDDGVKHAMSALESLINFPLDGKDRIIYQKHGEQSNIVRFILLTDALKELEESGQLHLAQTKG